jgi:hypothetical protein
MSGRVSDEQSALQHTKSTPGHALPQPPDAEHTFSASVSYPGLHSNTFEIEPMRRLTVHAFVITLARYG